MNNKIVIYFHGYNSSSFSWKVEELRKHFRTYSWDINVDPNISIPYLKNKIDDILIDNINDTNTSLVFVGTSLGAWYASVLSIEYNATMVAINPCYDPKKTLNELGAKQTISESYFDMPFPKQGKYFIAIDDEVIDFNPIKNVLNELNTTYVKNSNHRFNGKEFNLVIEYIQNLT